MIHSLGTLHFIRIHKMLFTIFQMYAWIFSSSSSIIMFLSFVELYNLLIYELCRLKFLPLSVFSLYFYLGILWSAWIFFGLPQMFERVTMIGHTKTYHQRLQQWVSIFSLRCLVLADKFYAWKRNEKPSAKTGR